MSEPKKKLIGPLELSVLLATLVLIAYILLKSNGGKVYERAHSTQITDNPTIGKKGKQTRDYSPSDNEESVELILQQLSENFTDKNADIEKEELWEENAVSSDELDFFKDVKKRYSEQDEIRNPADWLSILKASHKTYSKLKSVFEEAGDSKKPVKEDNVSSLLENAIVANMIYSRLEEDFNIPKEEAKAFANKGKKALSEWAKFVEEQSKKEQ